MKSGWNWFSLWHSKLPAESDVLTGNSSLIASAWSVDQQHIRASPCSRSPHYWSLPRPFFIYLCRGYSTQRNLNCAAHGSTGRGGSLTSFLLQQGTDRCWCTGSSATCVLPLQASCSCPGLIPQCCREHAERQDSIRRTKECLTMDLYMPLNGVSHLCACSFCPCSLGSI